MCASQIRVPQQACLFTDTKIGLQPLHDTIKARVRIGSLRRVLVPELLVKSMLLTNKTAVKMNSSQTHSYKILDQRDREHSF